MDDYLRQFADMVSTSYPIEATNYDKNYEERLLDEQEQKLRDNLDIETINKRLDIVERKCVVFNTYAEASEYRDTTRSSF
jgi:hypothetical protein